MIQRKKSSSREAVQKSERSKVPKRISENYKIRTKVTVSSNKK